MSPCRRDCVSAPSPCFSPPGNATRPHWTDAELKASPEHVDHDSTSPPVNSSGSAASANARAAAWFPARTDAPSAFFDTPVDLHVSDAQVLEQMGVRMAFG
jgi:hypothetical protein